VTVTELIRASALPRLEAEILLAHLLDKNRSWLIAHDTDVLDEQSVTAFKALEQRRLNGEPSAYITGIREFWSLPLKVNATTLIPRPDTELLVEQVLLKIPENQSLKILDLGTGSGAIALAIASERPCAQIIATDFSAEALGIAQENAENLSLHNIHFIQSHWYQAIPEQGFDFIVSNPPYIAADDPHLDTLGYEPITALTAGPDEFNAFKSILSGLKHYLVPNGWIALEHGHDQREPISDLCHQAGLTKLSTYDDLEGRPRLIVAQMTECQM